MLITDITVKYNTTEGIVEEALLVSGFQVDYASDYSPKDVSLAGLYIRYLVMMNEANEAAYGFKYTDGEEGIDKTSVNDNMRRTAQMWYERWEAEMEKRELEQIKETSSGFHIRKRVW